MAAHARVPRTLRVQKPPLLHHLGAIRGERREYRRRQAAEHVRLLGEPDPYDDDTTLVVTRWHFAGLGYLTGGDAALALSAAARAREHRQAARDAMA